MGGIEGVVRGSKVDEAEGLGTVAAELRQPLAAAIDTPINKLIALLVNGMMLTNHLNKVLIKGMNRLRNIVFSTGSYQPSVIGQLPRSTTPIFADGFAL
jgi:hypothetical protein